ncbi:hypothetical protein EVAR_54075_1 [Eumeta japonica]|uniref:Uncharacterized protein n=1 Tax=Eumeta variegata TaxID=151549 RepID=A0A4C1XG24_EUMVA|nr:hypothetical protein EVAR_54075_1 [Eumeta japonica]
MTTYARYTISSSSEPSAAPPSPAVRTCTAQTHPPVIIAPCTAPGHASATLVSHLYNAPGGRGRGAGRRRVPLADASGVSAAAAGGQVKFRILKCSTHGPAPCAPRPAEEGLPHAVYSPAVRSGHESIAH